MRVSELIELLQSVSDKDKPVTFADGADIVLVAVFADSVVLTDEME